MSKKRAHRTTNPWSLAGAGLELGGVVIILALLGWWLDTYFGTSPWLILTCVFIAFVGGTYNLYKAGAASFGSNKDQQNHQKPGQSHEEQEKSDE